jgi:hypothetical protein
MKRILVVMKRLFLTLVFIAYQVSSMYAQDIITKKTGDDIRAKVIEINTDVVKYLQFNNQSGPVFSISTSDIFMIKYENGSKDIFENNKPVEGYEPPQKFLSPEEQNDWDTIRKKDQIYRYEWFIKKYPSSEYRVTAKNRIKELEATSAVIIRMDCPITVKAKKYRKDRKTIWNWTTTFRAKNGSAEFRLRSSTYNITTGKIVRPPAYNASETIIVKKGKSAKKIFRSFSGEVLRGGVYTRIWTGEDGLGNHIEITETLTLL